jgi:L-seryl-tRNA(Ser) seleniumtransferase
MEKSGPLQVLYGTKGETMDFATVLGLRPIVNAVGPATRLGGLPLSDGVLEAMRTASERNVRMDELQEAAGARLAQLLGVPAVYVTSGASAGLTLATAVCTAGDDLAQADALPRILGPRRRVLVQRGHRDPYDHALTAAGAELTEIGFAGSTRASELEGELDGTVAAVLWRPAPTRDLLALGTVAGLAHMVGVPVIVDAAMDVPPVSRLQDLFVAGADLVVVSGGKGFRGPHTSGLLCGRPELVRAVPVHHLDMDIREQTWVPSEVTGASPRWGRHGIGRGMKVGREQIVGLLAAVEEYVANPLRHDASYEAELTAIEAGLAGDSRLAVSRAHNERLWVPELCIDVSGAGVLGDAVVRALEGGEPRIHVGEDEAWRGVLVVNPMGLREGEGALIAARVLEICAGRS